MKKTFVEIVFVALAYAFAILFGITVSANKTTRYAPESQLPLNISQKYANLQLLNRYGYISSNELKSISDQPKNDMSLEEYSALLDQLLEGREAELQESYYKSEHSKN